MPLPADTPITQLVDAMHLDQAAVDALSPAAKQVTKGELMALWGAPDEQAALQTYQTSGGTWTPSQATDAAPLDLTVSDIKAVQSLFKDAGPSTTDELAKAGGTTVQCCCCPCCCATTVLEPSVPVA